jgi:hypothetical protein
MDILRRIFTHPIVIVILVLIVAFFLLKLAGINIGGHIGANGIGVEATPGSK